MAYGPKRRNGEGEIAVLAQKTDIKWASTAPLPFLIVASVIGLALVPVLVLQPNLVHFEASMRQGLVGILYIVICAVGALAVFYPSKCKSVFQKPQNPQANPSALMKIRGHHPNCQNYSGNRIVVRGRSVCAACSGLLTGAIVALFGVIGYFFVGFDLAWSSVWLLVLGEVLMLLGLTQINFGGYVKAMVNMVFVVGSFVALVETDLLGESLLADFYALVLIMFMLWLRILLSDWNNKRICQRCRSCFQ